LRGAWELEPVKTCGGLAISYIPLVSTKGAKGANFWGSGFGTLAGQKLVSKAIK